MQKIETLAYSLTHSQKQVAGYFMSNAGEFVFKTAKDLGAVIGVSESTVVRFARMAGFDNFSEMQKFLQQEYMRHTKTDGIIGEPVDDSLNVLENMVKRDIVYLNKLLKPEFYSDFIKAAQMIVNAKRIYIGGSRGAASVAENFHYNINYIKPDVISLARDSWDWQNSMVDCDKRSLLVALSLPKYSKRTYNMMEFAKAAGAQIIYVTNSKIAPGAELADCVLACEIGLEYFIWSSSVLISVLHALLVQVVRMDQNVVQKRMQKITGIIENASMDIFVQS